jgi:dihydrofolate reductase
MRKLKIMEHISLDGVIQHSAGDGDFPYSDWTAPYRTPAGRDVVFAAYGASFDLLFGRRTFGLWACAFGQKTGSNRRCLASQSLSRRASEGLS